ncbi:MAG: hypothetical protein IJH78_08350 [Clostridia bacterium]|nr:hypothetical protein [Clostridia bacterium]
MKNMNIEIQKARNAGIRALNSLQSARKCLSSAGAWGLFDILGGGTITTLIKHGKIRQARGMIEEARRELREFERELEDVSLPRQEIGGFLTFFDIWGDNVLSDLLVQKRIHDLQEEIDRAIHQVEFVLSRLPA